MYYYCTGAMSSKKGTRVCQDPSCMALLLASALGLFKQYVSKQHCDLKASLEISNCDSP